jgi:hypothetical protein
LKRDLKFSCAIAPVSSTIYAVVKYLGTSSKTQLVDLSAFDGSPHFDAREHAVLRYAEGMTRTAEVSDEVVRSPVAESDKGDEDEALKGRAKAFENGR